MDYRAFIADHFKIVNKVGAIVPFLFNPVQTVYYENLCRVYGNQLVGVRDNVLKARQEGISSLILALFTVDFLHIPNSQSVCIAHRDQDTQMLFKKVNFFLDSACEKIGVKRDDLLKTDRANLIENKKTGAQFFIGTAGAKVAFRGGTVKNIHFSEVAHYPDTELITAREIVEGTSQMVKQGYGMIFKESTANGEGNYWHADWLRAVRRESSFRPIFFGAAANPEYTPDWLREKRREFTSEAMFKQEYPTRWEDAFITSGSPFFDPDALMKLRSRAKPPIKVGMLAGDGEWV